MLRVRKVAEINPKKGGCMSSKRTQTPLGMLVVLGFLWALPATLQAQSDSSFTQSNPDSMGSLNDWYACTGNCVREADTHYRVCVASGEGGCGGDARCCSAAAAHTQS